MHWVARAEDRCRSCLEEGFIPVVYDLSAPKNRDYVRALARFPDSGAVGSRSGFCLLGVNRYFTSMPALREEPQRGGPPPSSSQPVLACFCPEPTKHPYETTLLQRWSCLATALDLSYINPLLLDEAPGSSTSACKGCPGQPSQSDS